MERSKKQRKSSIELETCTKEELIYLIRQIGGYRPDELERIVRQCRANRALRNMQEADNASADATSKYISFLKKYEGKRLSEIPAAAIYQMDALQKEQQRQYATSRRYSQEWEKLLDIRPPKEEMTGGDAHGR